MYSIKLQIYVASPDITYVYLFYCVSDLKPQGVA